MSIIILYYLSIFYFIIFKFKTVMPTKSANLNVVSIDHYKQEFGNSEFLTVKAKTADSNEDITVSIEYDALRKNNIDPTLGKYFIGSTVVVKDAIRQGVTTPALDRINGILEGTSINPKTKKPMSLLLLNQLNCSILSSELYESMMLKLKSTTDAAIMSKRDEDRKLDRQRRAAERAQAGIADAAPVKKEEPVLETNDEENPF
jgi:hypothetical protein